jgi:hypothetical protein
MKLADANDERLSGEWWSQVDMDVPLSDAPEFVKEALAIMATPGERSTPTAVLSESEAIKLREWCEETIDEDWDDEELGEAVEFSRCSLKQETIYLARGAIWYVDSYDRLWLLESNVGPFDLISGTPPCRSYWMPKYYAEDFKVVPPTDVSDKVKAIITEIEANQLK